MEWTHVPVQGTNTGSPPHLPKRLTLPLNELWNQGIDPSTRQQVLRILSHVAAKQTLAAATRLTKPLEAREANDE